MIFTLAGDRERRDIPKQQLLFSALIYYDRGFTDMVEKFIR